MAETPAASHHEHFGPIIAFCEKGDIHLTPDGIEIFGDERRETRPAPFRTARAEVADALVAAVRGGASPLQTGRWGLASLEVCHAMLESAESGRPAALRRQIGVPS